MRGSKSRQQTKVDTCHKDETISTSLCSQCSKVDVRGLFFGDRVPEVDELHVRRLVGNLGRILANPNCPFCRIISFAVSHPSFSAVLEEFHFSSDDLDCFLEPWRADISEDTKFLSEEVQDMTATSLEVHLQVRKGGTPQKLRDFLILNIARIRLNCSNQQQFGKRPLLNGAEAAYPIADLALAKDWISTCRQFHAGTCKPEDIPGGLEAVYRKSFRLVEVMTRRIVQLDPLKADYAALSYVWGYSQDQYIGAAKEVLTGHNLPKTLPRTIEDALYLCARLDVHYLWVDLYCVDQVASVERNIQLRNMGNTYRQAVVTVVAAFGKDSDAGLPGVRGYSPNTTCGQWLERVDGLDLITGFQSLERQLDTSQWARRGWTFQEGLLSTRCLIFGGRDPIFTCRNGQSRQTLSLSPMEYTRQSKSSLDLTMEHLISYPLSSSIFDGTDSNNWTFCEYTKVVKGYLYRKLTRESDKLAALSGYLGIVTEKTGVQFAWGLPVQNLLSGLSWSGVYNEWQRLEESPSWSWSGWSLTWGGWPIFEDIRCSPDNSNGKIKDGRSLASCLVKLSRMNILYEHWPANCVIQTSAFVSLCPGYEQRRLKIESCVAKFDLVPLDPDSPLQYSDPHRGRLITPEMTICGRNGPVPLGNDDWIPSGLDRNEMFPLFLPTEMSLESFEWLRSGPMEFVMLNRWEEQGSEDEDIEYLDFHYTQALLLDPRHGDVARRFGIMLIPNEEWDAVSPERTTVFLE